MKLRATLLVFAVTCFLVTAPAWGQGICYNVPGNLVQNCGFETGNAVASRRLAAAKSRLIMQSSLPFPLDCL
jgi:hypothetical protein